MGIVQQSRGRFGPRKTGPFAKPASKLAAHFAHVEQFGAGDIDVGVGDAVAGGDVEGAGDVEDVRLEVAPGGDRRGGAG